MAEATIAAPRRSARREQVYFWLALTCLTISTLGFLPVYFIAMGMGLYVAEPVVHIHGMVMFSWMILFCVQTWLAANGRMPAHRAWGMLGVALIAAMVCTTAVITSLRLAQASAPGQTAHATRAVRAFAYTNMAGVLVVAPMFTVAIANIGRPEVHKRLMLVASVAMLGAPIARLFLLAAAGMPDPHPALLPSGVPIAGAPPIYFSIPPSLLGDLVLVAGMIHDKRALGRVHPTYWIGGGLLLAYQLAGPLIALSAPWQAFASALGKLLV